MKHTKQNCIKLIKAKIITCREMQDYMSSKGNFERAEYYKKQRWIYEDILEILSDSKKFQEEVNLHSLELSKIEKDEAK